ncbi:MAG: hypothetical protein LBU77_03950 [Clostridiales bacterium]|jgi:vacuolar-type H+-ATPase subunit H|nr:hypothetical protein [Clostridiales bacterium]
METIKDYLARIEDQLSKMEDLLESCRTVPFSGKVSVDKHSVYDIIDDLRPIIEDINKDLPNEIKQARRIIADSDKILGDARNKAGMVIKNAEAEAEKLVEEHEIVKRASQQAMQMIEETRKSARELRKNAIEYADEILAKAEESVRESSDKISAQIHSAEEFFSKTVDTLYENRKELRGIKE